MSTSGKYERPAIVGSGTIATGLAVSASTAGEVKLLARSEESASRAANAIAKMGSKVEAADPDRVAVTTEAAELEGCDVIVEAIVEDAGTKAELLGRLGESSPGADLATTTSSLSVAELGERSGHPDRLYGFHPFNPVPRMELVELCLPEGLREGIRDRARAWCEALGKRAVEVPDQAGFVVNRLLFPYLFDAVRLMDGTGMSAEQVDECMTAGAGQPMGPLRVLDFVGLDVSKAIGDSLHAGTGNPAHEPPQRMLDLIAEGHLGRKSGQGFHTY